jgi:RHS repeat-associated protein
MKPQAKTARIRRRQGTPVGLLLAFLVQLALPVNAQAAQDQTDYQYDAGGNLTHQTSPSAVTSGGTVVTDFDYDSLDRNTLITQPVPGNSGQAPIIGLGYDLLDQLTKVSDYRTVPPLDTKTPTTGLGTVSYTDSPDSGKPTLGINALPTNNAYDAAGNLKAETDARGITSNHKYDALNRLACSEYGTSSTDCSSPGRTAFIYDAAGTASVGKLTELRDESGTTSYSYDANGRLANKTQRLDGGQAAWTLAVGYGYGSAGLAKGKLQSISYPSGNQISYNFNVAGQISAITYKPANSNGLGTNTAATPTTLMANIRYTPTGRFYFGSWLGHSATTPNVNVHGIDTTRSDGRIKYYFLGDNRATPGGLTRNLQYDDAGRVTRMDHTGSTLGSQTPASFNQDFVYDNLGRLTGYTKGGTSQSVSYDASGNRTSVGATNYNVDAFSNRLNQAGLTAFNRQYDAAGNLLEDTNYTYSYSARGRLQSVTRKSDGATTAYAYNGLGQRTKKTGVAATTVTQYVYDEQGHLLGEYDYYGRPLQETVYLGDLPVAVLSQVVGGGSTTGAVTADNSVGSASPAASWPVATDAASQGGSHQTHAAVAGTSSDSFTWTLNLTSPGKYFIQARWTVPANTAMAGDATYTITGANTGGTTVRAIDQRVNSNTWAYLGLMTVTAAGPVTVKLSPSSTGKVSADAVRALPVTNATTSANNVFTDHLYAPRVITRASDNQMVWRWDNADPFGVGQPDTNPAGLATTFTYNPRFPGQLYDNETGLHYNYHRTYSPSIGGYTQPDPIGLNGGQLSLYAYVGGDPVNRIDPKGLFLQAVIPWIFPGLGQAIIDAATIGLGGYFIHESRSWYDDAEEAGEDAASEITDVNDDPDCLHSEKCKKISRQCRDKCMASTRTGGSFHDWLAVCSAACVNAKGCSPYQFPDINE